MVANEIAAASNALQFPAEQLALASHEHAQMLPEPATKNPPELR
jgi:hypothetical protein